MLLPGDRVGEWVVDEPLGEGGMGAVYRVHSALAKGLRAALKVMKPTAEPGAAARFTREAETLSALRHPAIVRVMGFGEDRDHGLLYLAMEFAEGETLARRLQRGPLPLAEALPSFRDLASALDHCHRAGIYHRDIKPSNLILCREGPVRLVDFGIAIHRAGSDTITGTNRGTLAYLPPEAFRGETPDPAAMDVYALGLVLHEALTGRKPFAVDAALAPAAAATVIGARKLESPAFDPGDAFPEPLREVIRQATSRESAQRPTVAVFHDRLASVAAGTPAGTLPAPPAQAAPAPATPAAPAPMVASTPPPPATHRVPDPPRASRRSGPLLAVGGAAALAVALAVLATAGREPAADRSPRGPDGSGAGEAREAPAEAVDVSGRWQVTNRIEETDHTPYRGLELGYVLTLRQQGRRVTGEGRKVSENGQRLPAARRTPILVTGESDGRALRLDFMEQGAQRNSAGTLDWRLSEDGRTITGSFRSDAAGSRGSSTARRRGGAEDD